MLVFGIKTKPAKKFSLSRKCSSCNSINGMHVYLFEKYVHLFYIPLFTVGKEYICECQHCKYQIKTTSLPSDVVIGSEVKLIKKKNWSVILILSSFAVLVFYLFSNYASELGEKNKELILHPHKGDIYNIKLSEDQFTLYKVESVRDDTVFYKVNLFQSSKAAGLVDIQMKGLKAYSNDVQFTTISSLSNMQKLGKIFSVDR